MEINSAAVLLRPHATVLAEHYRGSSSSQAATAHISVKTADGDTVSLNLSQQRTTTDLDYGVLSKSAGESRLSTALSHEQHQQQSVSFSVEGELDREELRDLRKLFRSVGRIVKSFFAGDGDHAAHRAEKTLQKFQRLDSLNNFDVELGLEVEQAAREQRTVTFLAPLDRPQATAASPASADSAPVATPRLLSAASTAAPQPAPASVELARTRTDDGLGASQHEPSELDERVYGEMRQHGLDQPRFGHHTLRFAMFALAQLSHEPALRKHRDELTALSERIIERLRADRAQHATTGYAKFARD